MFEEIKKEFTLKLLIAFLTIAVGLYLFRIAWQFFGIFSDILIILIISWLLSFILEPAVEKISQVTRLSKVLSTLIAYLLIFAIFSLGIFFFIPIVTNQIQSLSEALPRLFESSPYFTKNLMNLSETLARYLSDSVSIVASIAQFFFYVFIVLIISFYFIVDKERINKELFYLAPKKWHDELEFIKQVVNETFGSFLRVQIIFGIISGVLTWIVLRTFGIEFAAFASLLAGVFAIIPMLGPILAIIPPLVVALLADPTKAILVFIILLILQQVIFNVLGPKLLSKAFKLHPVVILLSFLIGGKIAGGVGAIFAIPILGIITVLIRNLGRHFLRYKD